MDPVERLENIRKLSSMINGTLSDGEIDDILDILRTFLGGHYTPYATVDKLTYIIGGTSLLATFKERIDEETKHISIRKPTTPLSMSASHYYFPGHFAQDGFMSPEAVMRPVSFFAQRNEDDMTGKVLFSTYDQDFPPSSQSQSITPIPPSSSSSSSSSKVSTVGAGESPLTLPQASTPCATPVIGCPSSSSSSSSSSCHLMKCISTNTSTSTSTPHSATETPSFMDYTTSNDDFLKQDMSDDKEDESSGCETSLAYPSTSGWSLEEDRRLIQAVNRFQMRNWKAIASEVGPGRTPDQCSQHWFRVLNPNIHKGKWTDEEDAKLLSIVREMGIGCWKDIAARMKNRTDIQVRYRYARLVKAHGKALRRMSHDKKTQNKIKRRK